MQTETTIPLAEKDIDRFWEKVDKTPGYGPDGDCWRWTGCTNNKQGGYGRFTTQREGRKYGLAAHRVSFVLAGGTIPPGLSVLHKCDNRTCVNPAHLTVGSHAANTADMFQKGRDPQTAGKRHEGVGLRLCVAEVATSRGVTLSQLMERVQSSAVKHMWYNRNKFIDMKTLREVSDALGVEPGELLVRDV